MKKENAPTESKETASDASSDEKLTRRHALKRMAAGLGLACVGLAAFGCLPGRARYRDSYSDYYYSYSGYSSYGYSSYYYSSRNSYYSVSYAPRDGYNYGNFYSSYNAYSSYNYR